MGGAGPGHDALTPRQVLDHYERPRNVGSLDKNDARVGTGLVGAPACGDVMKLQIRVNEEGLIEDVKFKTFGCGSAIASSSLATEWIKGKSLEEATRVKNTDIAKELCLPPVKLHCSSMWRVRFGGCCANHLLFMIYSARRGRHQIGHQGFPKEATRLRRRRLIFPAPPDLHAQYRSP